MQTVQTTKRSADIINTNIMMMLSVKTLLKWFHSNLVMWNCAYVYCECFIVLTTQVAAAEAPPPPHLITAESDFFSSCKYSREKTETAAGRLFPCSSREVKPVSRGRRGSVMVQAGGDSGSHRGSVPAASVQVLDATADISSKLWTLGVSSQVLRQHLRHKHTSSNNSVSMVTTSTLYQKTLQHNETTMKCSSASNQIVQTAAKVHVERNKEEEWIRIGATWDLLEDLVRSLAAAFWTTCTH